MGKPRGGKRAGLLPGYYEPMLHRQPAQPVTDYAQQTIYCASCSAVCFGGLASR